MASQVRQCPGHRELTTDTGEAVLSRTQRDEPDTHGLMVAVLQPGRRSCLPFSFAN